MLRVSSSELAPSPEIDGHSATGADKFVQRRFGAVCKLLWDKPDVEIAIIGKVEPRTARRWLRGEGDIPWCVLRAMLDEMLKPQE